MKTTILLALMLISLGSFAQTNVLRSSDGEKFISCSENKCLSQLKTFYDGKDYTGTYVRVITEKGEFELEDLNILIRELQESITDRDSKLDAARERMKKLGYRRKKLERIMKVFEKDMIDREMLHQGLVNLKSGIHSSKSSDNIAPMFYLQEFILFRATSYKMLDVDIQNFYEPTR